jgi:CRISPR-associated protein Cas1
MELVLTEFGAHLGKTGERLVVKRRDQNPVEFPAEQVKDIFIQGQGISISTDAIGLALNAGASITLLSFSGEPYAIVLPADSFGRARLWREQFRAADDDRGVSLCKSIIRGKLRNQVANLKYFAKSRKESAPDKYETLRANASTIESIIESIDAMPETTLETLRMPLMNREARGAREYWQAIAGILPEEIAFPGRDRHGATDELNVCLNYGYGILYARMWCIAVTVGLDPFAGFLHVDDDGKPTLIFDLVEEFRQLAVDRPVVSMFTKRWRPAFDEEGQLDKHTRAELARRIVTHFTEPIEYEGKSVKLHDVMKSEAYEIVNVILRNGAHEAFVANW